MSGLCELGGPRSAWVPRLGLAVVAAGVLARLRVRGGIGSYTNKPSGTARDKTSRHSLRVREVLRQETKMALETTVGPT